MTSVIIIQSEAGEDELKRCIDIASAYSSNPPIVVGEKSQLLSSQTTLIDQNIAESLRAELKGANEDSIVLVNSNAISETDLVEAFSKLGDLAATSGYCAKRNSDSIELDSISTADLVNLILDESAWAPALLKVPVNALLELEDIEISNGSELMATAVIRAISSGETLAHICEAGSFNSPFPKTSRARLLKNIINSANIEELYPNHSWSQHQSECAAVCYHTLAAHFLRLGSTELAMECLGLSDQLEDSPRSLALKALIAIERGETLGAVANLVSSLQQYELRKKSISDSHYVSFTPKDLELINTNLQAGLEALNKRDNNTALEKFAEAVFNFDSFYNENGLDDIQH